ncbi:MAG: hypothetical protein R3249_07880, partial [Nitriliruptorales bacterium]|nr:hypothetical protein [Nitriliruptorales bacterium]
MADELDGSGFGDEQPTRPRHGRGPTALRVSPPSMLGVLLLVAVVVAFLQWQRANDLANDADRRSSAAAAASDFVTELLGYDHRDLDSHEQRIGQSATDRFLAEYQRALDGGLRDNIVALEAVATVTVRDVFVGDVSSDR